MKRFFSVVLAALGWIGTEAKQVISTCISLSTSFLGLLDSPVVENVLTALDPKLKAELPGIEAVISKAITILNSCEKDLDYATVTGEQDLEKIEAQIESFILGLKEESPLIKQAIISKLVAIVGHLLHGGSSVSLSQMETMITAHINATN